MTCGRTVQCDNFANDADCKTMKHEHRQAILANNRHITWLACRADEESMLVVVRLSNAALMSKPVKP